MRSIRRTSLVLGILLVVAQTAGAQVASVTSLLPADSVAVIKITNLKAVSTKFKNLTASMGVAQFIGDFSDPLPALTKQLGITQGLDSGGDLVLALPMDAAMTVASGGTPDVLMLVPVTDYKAFLGNFAGAAQENGVDVFSFAGQTEKTYASSWGKFAAISPAKAMVQNKPAGLAISALCGKLFTDSDLTVYINPKPLVALALPQLEQYRTQLPQNIRADNAGSPELAKYVPVVRVLADEVFRGVERVLSDSSGYSMSINIKDNGIAMTCAGDFDPASYTGKLVASLKDTNKPLLAGLPAGDYTVFGGEMNNPEVLSAWMAEWIDPLIKASDDMGADGKPVAAMLGSIKMAAAKQKGSMFAMSMPANAVAGGPAAAGGLPMPQTVQVATGDSASLLTVRDQMIKQVTDMIGADTIKIETKDAAKTVSGVSFSDTKVTMPANGGGNAVPTPLGMFGLGGNGLESYTGAVDANSLLTVSNVPDDQIAKLIAGIKASDDSLEKDQAVTAVNAALPADRIAAVYFREPAPAGAPASSPVGMTLATQGSGARFDVYISGQTAMQIVQQAQQLYMQFAPQPAPGGAGPGAGPGDNLPPPMPGGGL
jgi:hypothetical protein